MEANWKVLFQNKLFSKLFPAPPNREVAGDCIVVIYKPIDLLVLGLSQSAVQYIKLLTYATCSPKNTIGVGLERNSVVHCIHEGAGCGCEIVKGHNRAVWKNLCTIYSQTAWWRPSWWCFTALNDVHHQNNGTHVNFRQFSSVDKWVIVGWLKSSQLCYPTFQGRQSAIPGSCSHVLLARGSWEAEEPSSALRAVCSIVEGTNNKEIRSAKRNSR